jgi:hypothetical protein
MVVKKPKITEKLPKGVKVRKGEKRKVPTEKKKEKDTRIRDRRRYTAARCDGKELVAEDGVVYYEGEWDTSKSGTDVLAILKNKGMI